MSSSSSCAQQSRRRAIRERVRGCSRVRADECVLALLGASVLQPGQLVDVARPKPGGTDGAEVEQERQEQQEQQHQEGQAATPHVYRQVRQEVVTTYERPMTPANAHAAWFAALLRDIAIVLAVIVYVIDTL